MKILSNGLFGFILGILIFKYFFQTMYHKQFHHGPNSNHIKKYVFQKGNKYFQFHTQICPCPI